MKTHTISSPIPMAVLVACAAACGSSTFDQPSEGIAPLEELRDGQTHEIPPQEGFVVAPIEEGAEMAATSRSNVIASLALPDGGEVHFLDLGPPEEPGVATLYTTHSDAVGSLMRDFEATPLELFLALASAEEAPPEVLFQHHARLASQGSAEPTARSLPVDDLKVPTEGTMVLTTDWTIAPCVWPTPATYFSGLKELWDGEYGFEVGAQDEEFFSSVTSTVYVQLGSSTSGWLGGCRDSLGPDGSPQMNLRFDQYSGGSWSSVFDPGIADGGWTFGYHDSVARQFRMAITAIGDDTAYVAGRF
jgi:hypothetical protein